jgi:hypothetical protein
MDNMKNTLITEAEEFERLSKIEVRRQNYEDAIFFLLQAKAKYEEAGLTGQVSILIKEIVKLKNLTSISPIQEVISSEDKAKREINHKENLEERGIETLEKAYESASSGELVKAIEIYDEAYNIYKKLNYDYECKQILWQINEIKEHQKWNKRGRVDIKNLPLKDIISLSEAEKRRRKIQEKLTGPKEKVKIETQKEISSAPISERVIETKKPKLLRQIQEREKKEQLKKEKEEQIRQEMQDIRLQKIKTKQEKLKAIQQQRKEEDELIYQANSYLDQANRNLKNKKYDEAKEFYTRSIKIFTSLGWNNQVKILSQELKNIEIYKKEAARKEYLAQQRIVQSEQKFQKRVSTVIDEKERFLEKKRREEAVLPPEIKLKLEKAQFTKEKAEKEEKIPNLERALARYKYVLELYKSIPPESLDISEEIKYIKQKVSELKEKM